MVWRFDRFARSVKQLVLGLEEFRALGIDFVTHQEALDSSTPLGKAMFTIIGAMAELERDIIYAYRVLRKSPIATAVTILALALGIGANIGSFIADILLVREALRSYSTPADSVSAFDGEQGLQLLTDRTLRPDLILLDENLPKFSGLELLEPYNTQDGAPVIALTSSDDADDRERALELGAREYIQKPVGFHEFVDVIHDIVDRWASTERSAARAI